MGALKEAGETLAANLTTQGVPSTWDEGLTTLIGKVLDITPGPTPSYDGVSLTSDKSILSYADSDSCTLTAQLLDGSSSASVSGVTVEFFNGSTSLGTAETNSSGVATKTYSSAGVGDISLTAEAGTFVSETYSIMDCLFYDSGANDSTATWTNWTGYEPVLTRNTEYCAMTIASGKTDARMYKQFTGDSLCIEFDVLVKSNSVSDTIATLRNNSTNVRGNFDLNRMGLGLNTWHHIKMVYNGTTVVCSNNTNSTTYTYNINDLTRFYFQIGSNTSELDYKNFMIYPI
jgi:hypothetical protein